MKQSKLETFEICGKELSVWAEVCPHYGDQKYSGNQFGSCFWGMFIVVASLLIFWAFFRYFYLCFKKLWFVKGVKNETVIATDDYWSGGGHCRTGSLKIKRRNQAGNIIVHCPYIVFLKK